MKSKKILAALVAIPASVVVADGALAVEDQKTTTETKVVTFNIQNELVHGTMGSTDVIAEEDLNTELAKEIFKLMDEFKDKSTVTLTLPASLKSNETNLQYAKRAVKEVFDYLKTNLNNKTNFETSVNYDTTLLYGMFDSLSVEAVETIKTTNEDDSSSVTRESEVKLQLKFDYLGSDSVKAAINNGTTLDATGARTASNNVLKIKAIHDYLINRSYVDENKHDLYNLTTQIEGMSSHAYALWTYALIKQLNSDIDVRYVYGLSNGQPRSWVLVKLDDTEPKPWYHLDIASNDNTQKDSKDIKYLHFLTGDPSYVDYIINIGGIEDSKINKENKLWANIVNPITFGGLLTYVDPSRGGKIYSINLGSFNESQRFGTDTSLVNNIYSYKEGSTEYIYYLNTNVNNTLYRFNTGSGSPVQIINESLKSISVSDSTLTYILLDGKDTEKKVSLNDIESNLIDKVRVAMDDYLKLISPSEAQKLNVLTAFNTLTIRQKDKLKAITVSDLEGTPKEIYKDLINDLTTKVDGEVLNVINSINTLASSKTWTISGIETIEAAYNSLKPAQQALVTNVKVLDNAIEQMGLAKKIQTDIPIFLNKYKLTTSIDKGFYTDLKDLKKRIQELTTALYSIFDPQHLKGLEDANKNRIEAEKEIQVFVNDLNKINVNSKDYITVAKKLEDKYESIADNRKVLLTGTQLDSYNKHVRDAKKMVEAINDFNTKYENEIKEYSIDAEGVPFTIDGKIKATEYGKMLAAYKLYSDMKPSQLVQINSEVGDKIVAINKYITILMDSSKEILNKITVEITNLDEAVQNLIKEFKPKMDDLSQTITDDDISKNIEEYKDLVSSAEVAIKTLVTKPDTTPTPDEITALINETLALLDDEISKKFMAYKDLAGSPDNKVKIIQDSVNDLTEESGPEEITKVKEDYDLLEDVYKLFINTSPLKKELIRIQDSINAKEAEKFLEDITKILSQTPAATLEEVQALLDTTEELKEPVKSLVKANEEYKKLEELQTKLKKDKLTEEEIKKLIAEIIADIKKLTMDSKPADFAAIEAKYNTLSAENKEKVMNFKDIAELKAKIEAATKEKTDKSAAEKVIEMIQVLNTESTSAEIKAARDAYVALTEEAKKLVNDRVLQNLVYFESLLATQTEQAEKEAKTVMDRISRIDKTKYTETQIKSIRMAYNALSDLAKSLVTNLHVLIDAENYVIYQNTVVKQAKLDANAFDLHMDTITRNSTTQEIARARSLYNNLSAEAKRHVTTLEKLVRLETMWNDPQYIELVHTYYPDYVHAVKPGAIVVEKPKHDPLYIPDDSTQIPSSVATSVPKTASWSQYETMTHQNGRYTTQITSTQVKNIADRNMRLKAGDVDIVIPTSEIQSSTAAIGVALNIVNNQLNIQFTEGNNAKNFSSYVEIHVPMSTLKGNTSQIIERITTTSSSPASFKVDGSNFIIRTTSGGTFKVTTGDIRYTDIQNNAQGNAFLELAKRGITFNTTNRLVQSYKQVDKLDVMTMIASALDLSSNSKSKYMDLDNAQHLKHAQGLLEAGIMSGATSSRFAPNTTVTKQEAAIIIANMYRYLNQDLSKVYNELTSNYRDIANLTLEARQSIAILELFGVVDGTGAFNPTQTLSRGEFAELFYKALSAIDYL